MKRYHRIVSANLTEEQFAALQKKADETNLRVSEYVRALIAKATCVE